MDTTVGRRIQTDLTESQEEQQQQEQQQQQQEQQQQMQHQQQQPVVGVESPTTDDPPATHGARTAGDRRRHPYHGCSELFVGAGWGGVYSFYRRVLDRVRMHKEDGSSFCLIEQSNRIGGRTYSVPLDEHTNGTKFVLDVGAYRFTPDMHLVGDLILQHLQLPTECYQPGCPSPQEEIHSQFDYKEPFRRIVDPISGLPNGFDTALRKMVEICQGLGARVFLNTQLVQLQVGDELESSSLHLVLENTVTGVRYPIQSTGDGGTNNNHSNKDDDFLIRVLVLNIPRHQLFQIQGMKESMEPDVAKTLECLVLDSPMPDVTTTTIRTTSPSNSSLSLEDHSATIDNQNKNNAPNDDQDIVRLGKAYLYYEDAWWRTKLNQTVGSWPPEIGFDAVSGVHINIRWHDGPVHCHVDILRGGNSSSSLSTEPSCRGFLEVYYYISNETFYSSLPTTMHDVEDDWNSNNHDNNNNHHHQESNEDPLGMLWVAESPHARNELELVHEILMQSLKPLWNQTKALWNASQFITPPTGLVVGIWQMPNPPQFPLGMGWTAPTKVYYESESHPLDKACGVPGLTQEAYRNLVLQPFEEDALLVSLSSNRQGRTRRRRRRMATSDTADQGIRTSIFLVNNDYVCNNMHDSPSFGYWAEEPLLQAERALYILGTPKPSWLIDSYYQINVIKQVLIRPNKTATSTTPTTPSPSSTEPLSPMQPVSLKSLAAQRGLIPLVLLFGMAIFVISVEMYHRRKEEEKEEVRASLQTRSQAGQSMVVVNGEGNHTSSSYFGDVDPAELRRHDETGEKDEREGEANGVDDNIVENDDNIDSNDKEGEEYDAQQLWRLSSVAILVSYWVVGTSAGLFRSFLNVYPIDIGASEAQQTTLATLSALPAAFKILYGFTSDTLPIFGYRRKPYLFLGWFLSSMIMLFLYTSSDLTLSRRPPTEHDLDELGNPQTGEVVVVPETAPSLLKLSACAFLFGFGLWFASCMTDALVAEKARFEPSEVRGSLQSSCYIVRFFGLMVAAPVSTYLYSKVGPQIIVQCLIWVPCLVFPPLWYLAEHKEVVKPVREQCREIWRTVCSRSVWEPMAFLYCFNLMQVSNGAWRQFLVTVYGFTAANLNTLLVVSYVLIYLGTMIFKFCLLQTSWRLIYQGCLFLNLIFSSLQLLLIKGKTFGISPFAFALGDDAFAEFLNGIQFLPAIIMMVSLCPTGSEGTYRVRVFFCPFWLPLHAKVTPPRAHVI